ncbi:MAG: hypothetical protein WB996_00190 [Ignavibacteriaceae bacterium]
MMGSIEYYIKMNSKQAFGLRGIGILGKITGSDNRFVPDKFITDYVLAGGGVVYSYDASPNLFPIYKGYIKYLVFTKGCKWC